MDIYKLLRNAIYNTNIIIAITAIKKCKPPPFLSTPPISLSFYFYLSISLSFKEDNDYFLKKGLVHVHVQYVNTQYTIYQ